MISNAAVNKAIEYIITHMSENITAEQVAEHCHISKYHFSRLFKAETGESVYSFIKRFKLEQSAIRLKAERGRPITEIGLDYGYSSSNYSWAFRKHFAHSPVKFREEIKKRIGFEQKIFSELAQQIEIKELPDYLVTYERYINNYSTMKENWCDFVEKHKHYVNASTLFFDRTFDDPNFTDANRCVYDICMQIRESDHRYFENTCVLEGGKFAVYPFKGRLPEIYPIHQELIGIWFAGSGYELDDRYSYSLYKLVMPDCYMEFDICIPIK